MRGLVPSTLLPPLPRGQGLAPLSAVVLLNHMAVLQEMYMPPIHGGFLAGDVELDEPEYVSKPGNGNVNGSGDAHSNGDGDDHHDGFSDARRGLGKRTLSGGSVELAVGLDMEGLGLNEIDETDEEDYDDDEDEDDDEHNDPFEREWAEKWLSAVVRRAQMWLEADGSELEHDDPLVAEHEAVLREATAGLALMAGTSAAGSLTRHLVFPLAAELAPALRALRPQLTANPNLSPETRTFLASLATSPASPLVGMRALPMTTRRPSASASSASGSLARSPRAALRRRQAALPVLLHDAPMGDHLSVGVQTWGSSILLGREMALRPADFGLFQTSLPHGGGTRVLDLGAGTGLLSILCRKLLDLRAATTALPPSPMPGKAAHDTGLVVATDFHPDVLANLRVCVDLNAPPRPPGPGAAPGIEIAKLDWTTFPAYMDARARGHEPEGEEELAPWVDTPFDLVLASDCVYDPTHAQMLRSVAAWVLRLPEGKDEGGTFHILSPIRPTFTPELESIDTWFPPLSTYPPLAERAAAAAKASKTDTPFVPEAVDASLRGEGLGAPLGLRLGVRGAGKRSVRGRKGEGRTDEVSGYWWWEVRWG